MGYGLSSEMIPIGPRACFWGGWGGSIVMLDLDDRLVVSYVMNRMADQLLGDPRGADILFAAAIGATA
jgi:CubicO group peptidase (beta-lactamase class C family)